MIDTCSTYIIRCDTGFMNMLPKDFVLFFIYIYIFVFNATFSNISAISWRPVLVVEEAGVPGENHRPWASN